MDVTELRRSVEALHPQERVWPAPHPDRPPLDEEYSRCADPEKYRVLHERLQVWAAVLVEHGLALVEPAEDAVWRDGQPASRRTPAAPWRLRPRLPGALPLLVVPGQDDQSVEIGAGDPAVTLTSLPVCGCDACDDGGAVLLTELDDRVCDVVSGDFVRVQVGDGQVTGFGDGWSSTTSLTSEDVERILVEARAGRSPHDVVRGNSWG